MIRPPRVPPPSEVITPGGAPPGRPANIRSAQLMACAAQDLQVGAVCLQRSSLLDAMRMIVPAVNGISRHGGTVEFGLAYPSAGAGGPGRVRVPAPITCSRAAASPSHPANG